MNTQSKHSLKKSFDNGQGKDKVLVLNYIISQVEKGTGLTLLELKQQYKEEHLFYIGLKHVTTTKKAFCKAMDIPVEAGCRYKRKLEKIGHLVQSINKVVCPYTKDYAHEISTNPDEFVGLLETNQLTLF